MPAFDLPVQITPTCLFQMIQLALDLFSGAPGEITGQKAVVNPIHQKELHLLSAYLKQKVLILRCPLHMLISVLRIRVRAVSVQVAASLKGQLLMD